ncbi:hypothetical protein ACROYT_G040669 [Oculina patagonica]
MKPSKFTSRCSLTYGKSVTMENTEEEPLILGSVNTSPILTDQNKTRNVPWRKLAVVFSVAFLLWQLIGDFLYVARVLEQGWIQDF